MPRWSYLSSFYHDFRFFPGWKCPLEIIILDELISPLWILIYICLLYLLLEDTVATPYYQLYFAIKPLPGNILLFWDTNWKHFPVNTKLSGVDVDFSRSVSYVTQRSDCAVFQGVLLTRLANTPSSRLRPIFRILESWWVSSCSLYIDFWRILLHHMLSIEAPYFP